MELSNLIYNYERTKGTTESLVIKEDILKIVKENSMSPLYETLSSQFGWEVDTALVDTMKESNANDLKAIEQKLDDATKNAGDTEIIESIFSKAQHFSKIGSWKNACDTFDEVLKQVKISTGKKIDAWMEKIKIYLFNSDIAKIKEAIGETKKLVEKGGDWDRRNRLKVYEALYFIIVRDLKQASPLLLDCIATFTTTELCSYKQFMFYTIIVNVMCLNRIDLKKKLIADPHVITIIRELPTAQKLLNGLYGCDYFSFFRALVEVQPELTNDRLFGPLVSYILREYRIIAYSQFLESYKSVLLSSMAQTFGITSQLLDAELSSFISSGRLNAKIDKVGDMIETRRPDKKNIQYQDVIKKGDVLLNQIQKLVRVIDV